jgi:nifR3 family TIM-barrel protein
MTEQQIGKAVAVGPVRVPGRVWLAPMTGISDLPFRAMAAACGAAYVATEMVACAHSARRRPDVVRRAFIERGGRPSVVQLVGGEAEWIAEGARLAQAAGADIIDLNFGCPAKEVTGKACGSALMRDVDQASRLIAAAVEAVDVPVTVKMRLGWDDGDFSAPRLAQAAQNLGARAVTVHARTRAQFYSGEADWRRVAEVKAAVNIPVIINGDILDAASAKRALKASGADAVMVGRAAIGRPWIGREIENGLDAKPFHPPTGEALAALVADHLAASLRFYGEPLGLRVFKKHLAAYISAAPHSGPDHERREARQRLCRLEAPGEIVEGLRRLWRDTPLRAAA